MVCLPLFLGETVRMSSDPNVLRDQLNVTTLGRGLPSVWGMRNWERQVKMVLVIFRCLILNLRH